MEDNRRPTQSLELNLLDIWDDVRRHINFIVFLSVIALVVGVVISFIPQSRYKAELLAVIVDEDAGIPSLNNRFSSLAGLAGINLNYDSKASYILAVLESKKFIIKFLRDNKLDQHLIDNTETWEEKDNTASEAEEKDCPQCSDQDKEITDIKLYKRFMKNFELDYDKRNNVIKMTYVSTSPVEAARTLNLIISDINQKIREEKVSEAKEALAYLRAQIESTPLKEMHEMFYELIKHNTEVAMLANVRRDYALKVVDPAMTPERPYYPNKKLIVLMVFSIVSFIYMLILFFRNIKRTST